MRSCVVRCRISRYGDEFPLCIYAIMGVPKLDTLAVVATHMPVIDIKDPARADPILNHIGVSAVNLEKSELAGGCGIPRVEPEAGSTLRNTVLDIDDFAGFLVDQQEPAIAHILDCKNLGRRVVAFIQLEICISGSAAPGEIQDVAGVCSRGNNVIPFWVGIPVVGGGRRNREHADEYGDSAKQAEDFLRLLHDKNVLSINIVGRGPDEVLFLKAFIFLRYITSGIVGSV